MTRLACSLAFAALLLPSAVYATSVSPGDPLLPIGTGSLNGATLIDSMTHPFSFVGSADVPGPGGSHNPYSFTGSFNEYVYRESGGTLDFAYKFTITSRTVSGPFFSIPFGGIRIVELIEYTPGITSDVLLLNDAGNSFYPTSVLRSTTVVNLEDFVPAWGATRQSATDPVPDLSTLPPKTFFVRTNATQYDSMGLERVTYVYGFVGGDMQVYNGTFRPLAGQAAPVPEPLSLLTLPLAIGALLLRSGKKVRE
jgi:hypothetical protein